MSDTEVDKSACSSPYCGMLATSTRSTRSTKGDDWLCFIHMQAEQRDHALISQELARLAWLVKIVRSLRMAGRLRNWTQIEGEARQAIILAQRGDLHMKDSESLGSWMIRLEGVLQQSCRDSLVQA